MRRLMVILFALLTLSCSGVGTLSTVRMAEGDWTQLKQCVVTDDPEVYQCPREVLESVWDCMIKCYYDNQDCEAKLMHCEQLCELDLIECKGDLSQCKTNHWYWGGGGAAASALLILLLVLL